MEGGDGTMKGKKRKAAKSAWTVHRAPTGRLYYFNNETKKSSWECPLGMEGVQPAPKKKKGGKKGSRKRKRKDGASGAGTGTGTAAAVAAVAATSGASASVGSTDATSGKRRRVMSRKEQQGQGQGQHHHQQQQQQQQQAQAKGSAATADIGAEGAAAQSGETVSTASSPTRRPAANPYEAMSLEELRVLLRSGDLVMERMASLRQVILTYLRKAPGDAATVVRSLADGYRGYAQQAGLLGRWINTLGVKSTPAQARANQEAQAQVAAAAGWFCGEREGGRKGGREGGREFCCELRVWK